MDKKIYDSRSNKYTESVTVRNETIENCDIDFLDKIKAVQYLTEDMILSIDQVAFYYETNRTTISSIIQRHRNEFESDGMVTLTGQELKDFKKSLENADAYSKINKSLVLLTKRSLLRVGMLLTNNPMAERIRNYLLNIEEQTETDRKAWAIQREVGIIERKRMTTALAKFLPNDAHKRFAYPNYTNMIYKCLFNRTAKDMREEKGLETNDALRDTFTAEQLALVEEAETIVTALVSLGFTYFQIKEQLEHKYIKAIE